MEPNPECLLKPGEECGWCRYRRPKGKPRILCHICKQPFQKGEKKRLLRGKWIHKENPACLDLAV